MAKRILIVDDEKPFHDLYKAMLDGKGYDVVCVYDVEDAMENVRQEKPDLIITDIAMNMVSGDTFILYLKGMPEYVDVPVMVVSGIPQSDYKILKEMDPKIVYIEKFNLTSKELLEEVEKKLIEGKI
jgi:CheY-like chemotaxis protein